MKITRIILVAVASLFVNLLMAQHYTPTDEGSEVKFRIKNFGVTVGGDFTGLKGDINFEPNKLNECRFEATVVTGSLNTGIGLRDRHLKKEEYFNADKYPLIEIKSIKITNSTKEGWLYFYGALTLKGVTKEISFPFQVTEQNGGYRFNGEFKINRRDYGVGGSSFSLSDNLTVVLNVFAKKV